MNSCIKHLIGPTMIGAIALANPASAGVKSLAAREAAEYLLAKFGKEAAKEGTATLTRKIEFLVARHGHEALLAVKKVGPRAFRLVEQAGAHSPAAVKLMARFGNEAVCMISRPKAMALFVKYGDEAAAVLLKHTEVVEPVIEAYAAPAVRALQAVKPRNGRRMAMMMQNGRLKKIGRTAALLEVVAKDGDRALDFIWQHQEALAITTHLTAFLIAPERYLDGRVDLAKSPAESASQPSPAILDPEDRELPWSMKLILAGVGVTLMAVGIGKSAGFQAKLAAWKAPKGGVPQWLVKRVENPTSAPVRPPFNP
jgi:hypothetical protein